MRFDAASSFAEVPFALASVADDACCVLPIRKPATVSNARLAAAEANGSILLIALMHHIISGAYHASMFCGAWAALKGATLER